MKTFVKFISYIGLMLGISLTAHFAQAANQQCKTELKPFYRSFKSYDGSESKRQQLISSYHSRRTAIYSVCGRNMLRKFEKDYAKRIQGNAVSQNGTVGYYPKVRKTVDLGEVEESSLSSRSY